MKDLFYFSSNPAQGGRRNADKGSQVLLGYFLQVFRLEQEVFVSFLGAVFLKGGKTRDQAQYCYFPIPSHHLLQRRMFGA